MTKTMNNVVNGKTLREIQSKTLKELSDILKNSFGPNGSNACIKKENAFSRYSKDGHTIIGALHYNSIIEQSIKDDIESITRHIVKTVGDGTTSAVILSSLIFEKIRAFEKEYRPSLIVREIDKVVTDIKDRILKTAAPLSLNDVFNIAMISTNGNEYISKVLKDIYEEFGNGVFIDVSPSLGEELVIKSYNGMTLNTGYCDSCYVTDAKNNTAEVSNPEVYFFEHPVDTRELGVFFDAILSRNIVQPVNNQDFESLIPTVIFAPKISQDMSSVMDSLTATMASMPVSNKLPVCIITDYHEIDQLNDLAKMCGAKLIRKYIDPKMYENDVARGAAPTPETIFNWGGRCDKVVAYSDKTTFIRPSKMYKEDGDYSELYYNLLNFLETEISNGKEDGEDALTLGRLKRRLHSLKSNFVELFVGGITQADRDALRDLVEDAVLNIRSAADNGVGLGANMSAMVAVFEYCAECVQSADEPTPLDYKIATAMKEAYIELAESLYEGTTTFRPELAVENAKTGYVYNLRTSEWSDNVKTSIMSDVTIMDTVSKIITLMATSNQFIVPTAMHNIYVD